MVEERASLSGRRRDRRWPGIIVGRARAGDQHAGRKGGNEKRTPES